MLFVVETTPERLMKVINANASLKKLVENRWIRLAAIDPETGQIQVRRDRGFEALEDRLDRLPVAHSSGEWYARKSRHLPMAWIQTEAGAR